MRSASCSKLLGLCRRMRSPGENRAEAIRELLTASACCEVEAVGEEACRAAIALIGKVVDRMADDARAAEETAEAAGRRPC